MKRKKKERKKKVMEIGNRLQKLREHLHYSREQMALHCEVTRGGYAKYERGDYLPKLVTLEQLSKKFDTSLDWLLLNKGPMSFKEKMPEEKIEPPGKIQEKNTQEKLPGPEQVIPDVKELLDYMNQDPLLRYEILVYFYKYKKENTQPNRVEKPDEKLD